MAPQYRQWLLGALMRYLIKETYLVLADVFAQHISWTGLFVEKKLQRRRRTLQEDKTAEIWKFISSLKDALLGKLLSEHSTIKSNKTCFVLVWFLAQNNEKMWRSRYRVRYLLSPTSTIIWALMEGTLHCIFKSKCNQCNTNDRSDYFHWAVPKIRLTVKGTGCCQPIYKHIITGQNQ